MLTITNQNFETEVINSDKPVLLDFWAEWCMPCKMFLPIVEEIANEESSIKVGKVNVDSEMELASKYQIASIPTLVLIKNGEVLTRIVGMKSKEEVMKEVKAVL